MTRLAIVRAMSTSLVPIEELHAAIRLKRSMERAAAEGVELDPERIRELDRYIEITSQLGLGDEDHLNTGEAPEGSEAALVLAVTWDTPSDLWRAVRRNINKDGVFIQTSEFPSIDTLVQLEVVIRRPQIRFGGPAKVIWVNPHQRSGRPMGMGLKFQWDNPADKDMFRSFLRGDIDPSALNDLG